jgi:tellurite resistance protein
MFANRMGSSANGNEINKLSKSENISCRVRLEKTEKEGLISDVLTVEICGSTQAPADTQSVTLRAELMDVTNEYAQGQPVLARANQAQGQDSATFYYEADLGKVYQTTITLTDWTPVARIRTDLLLFPRRGKRNVRFRTALLSSQSREEIACANCNFSYENTSPGYIDLHENIQHAKTLTVGLAFAVGAADNKLSNCEVDLIKTWAMKNIDLHRSSGRARRKLKKALKKTAGFFQNGGRLNCYEICRDIVQISPLSNRYEILNLCLHVAQTKGSVSAKELAILKNLARWLEVDMDKFRGMMENILPANMHEVRDIEAILGLTADMQVEYARQQLNKEYAKWNSRVTNSDPEVQSQADMMLNLIAEARNDYVESDTPLK